MTTDVRATAEGAKVGRRGTAARREPTPEEIEALVAAAWAARKNAYAPYSRFRVGAALRDRDGRVHPGCNVESASYGLSMCAERVAIFAAVAAGAPRPFAALAVACPEADPALGAEGRMPCGACRQVMAEHLAPDAPIAMDGVGVLTLDDLLPRPFRLRAPTP